VEPTIYPAISNEDYDRTPSKELKLDYKDVLELMTIQCELKRKYEMEAKVSI
jgi:hypothetical protein